MCSKVSALRLIFGKISQSFLLTWVMSNLYKMIQVLIITNLFKNIGMNFQQVSMYESVIMIRGGIAPLWQGWQG